MAQAIQISHRTFCLFVCCNTCLICKRSAQSIDAQRAKVAFFRYRICNCARVKAHRHSCCQTLANLGGCAAGALASAMSRSVRGSSHDLKSKPASRFDALCEQVDTFVLKVDRGRRTLKLGLFEQPINVVLIAMNQFPLKDMVHQGTS